MLSGHYKVGRYGTCRLRTGGQRTSTGAQVRGDLEDRKLGSSSIIIRMSAIRKLAAEAADNGLLAPELATGIARVKSAKTQGIRNGELAIAATSPGFAERARHHNHRGASRPGDHSRSSQLRTTAI